MIDTSKTVISAQDYDMWGHTLENRTYNADQSKYDFTSKERDLETNYDYFGARYYDSRIGRWGSIDPLLEKHKDFTPYNYVLNNTLVLVDPEGKQVRFSSNEANRNQQLQTLRSTLPQEVGQFVNTTVDANQNYILDAALLRSSNNESEEVHRLLTVAESNEETELIFQDENAEIVTHYLDNKGDGHGNLGQQSDGRQLWGYTVPSGNVDNPNAPTYTSLSGHTEVYTLNSLSERNMATTLAHELYGHVYNYISGNAWQHTKDKKSAIERDIVDMENLAASNYDKTARRAQ